LNYLLNDANTERHTVRSAFSLTQSAKPGRALAIFSVLMVIFAMASVKGFAQTAGSISGHLADPAGASLPQTDVTLTNVGTNTSRATKSTDSGDYTFPDVPPGNYKVQVQHQGFKTAVSETFEVQVAQSVKLNLTLQIGAVADSVSVSAAGTLLQADNAALGTVVEAAELKELPLLNGRNYLGLVGLASNVNTLSGASGQAGGRLGGERAGQAIAVGGQRIMFDYYTLDGVVNTDPDFNTYISQPSIDGIGEMKVQTGVYSAEFGHEASQINVLTKSGTNSYHGSMYEFVRNNYVEAQQYYFPTRSTQRTPVTPFKYNDFGFELDGPVRIPKIINGKDKLFFMVDEEWYRTRSSNPNNNATVPTPQMAAGNFNGYFYQWKDTNGNINNQPVIINDPLTGQPFANNTIPTNRIASQSTALLQYLGAAPGILDPNNPVAQTGTPAPAAGAPNTYQWSCPTAAVTKPTNCTVIPNYKYTTVSNFNRSSLTARGDYYMSQKAQFAFRYSYGDENQYSTGLKGAGTKLITKYHQYMGSNTYTFSPSVVNDARFGYSYFMNSQGFLAAFSNNVVGGLGIPGLNAGDPSTWGVPSMSFNSSPFANDSGATNAGAGGSLFIGTAPSIYNGFGDNTDGPYVVTDPIWQIVDNVTWVKGKHSLRLGFEYNRQTFNQLGNQFSRGQFASGPLTTSVVASNGKLTGGDSLADFLLGNLSQSTVAVAVAKANYVRNVESAYVEDTYKVTPKLTLSAGLRYELTPPWRDTNGNDFNVLFPVIPKVGDISTTYGTASTPATYNPDGSLKTAGTYNPNYPYYARQGNCDPSQVYQGIAVRWTASNAVCSNGKVPGGALMNTIFTNFAPRIGISYSPMPKTVVRLGFGIFYNQDIGNAYFDMERNIAGRVTVNNSNSQTAGAASDVTWTKNATPGGSGGAVVSLPPTTVGFANASTHHTSYSEEYLLNVQQQIGKNWSVEAGYQGSVSRHLYGFFNANQPSPFGLLGPGTGYSATTGARTSLASRTPFQNVLSGAQMVHDEGMGNYNAASVKVNRRFSRGMNLTASYTYSKAMDDTSGVRNQGNDQLNAQNGLCIPCEYGPSAFDVRNRISINGLYELPIGPGKMIPVENKLVNTVIGGWQVGGAFTHQTGQVVSPEMGSDNSGLGGLFGNFDRPNTTGVSPYLPCNTLTVDHCANPAAYSQPGVIVNGTNIGGLWGNAQRNSVHGPGFTNLNASLHKNFNMPYNEKHQLALRFEVTNALNHPNWGTPNITNPLTSSTFGRVGAGGMRTMQLGAKYQF